MAIWIDRVAAPLARRTAGGDDRLRVSAQRGSLTPGEEDAEVPAVLDDQSGLEPLRGRHGAIIAQRAPLLRQ